MESVLYPQGRMEISSFKTSKHTHITGTVIETGAGEGGGGVATDPMCGDMIKNTATGYLYVLIEKKENNEWRDYWQVFYPHAQEFRYLHESIIKIDMEPSSLERPLRMPCTLQVNKELTSISIDVTL